MRKSRNKFTKYTFATIEPMIPCKEGVSGRTSEDNFKFLNAVLWIIGTGCPWRDLPGRFGKWNSVY